MLVCYVHHGLSLSSVLQPASCCAFKTRAGDTVRRVICYLHIFYWKKKKSERKSAKKKHYNHLEKASVIFFYCHMMLACSNRFKITGMPPNRKLTFKWVHWATLWVWIPFFETWSEPWRREFMEKCCPTAAHFTIHNQILSSCSHLTSLLMLVMLDSREN